MRCAQVRRGWEGSGAEAGARATTSPAPSHGHLSGPSSQRRPHGRRAGRAIRVRARGLRIVRSTLRHPGRPRWSANRQDGSPSGQMPAASSLGPVTRAASTTAAGPRGSVTASITVDRLERERAPDRAVLHRPGRAASRSREHLERLKGRGLAARAAGRPRGLAGGDPGGARVATDHAPVHPHRRHRAAGPDPECSPGPRPRLIALRLQARMAPRPQTVVSTGRFDGRRAASRAWPHTHPRLRFPAPDS